MSGPTDRGVRYEADPRHVELIVEALDLHGDPKAVTPGIKEPDADLVALLDVNAAEDALDPEVLADHVCSVFSAGCNKIKGSRPYTLGRHVHVRFGGV